MLLIVESLLLWRRFTLDSPVRRTDPQLSTRRIHLFFLLTYNVLCTYKQDLLYSQLKSELASDTPSKSFDPPHNLIFLCRSKCPPEITYPSIIMHIPLSLRIPLRMKKSPRNNQHFLL